MKFVVDYAGIENTKQSNLNRRHALFGSDNLKGFEPNSDVLPVGWKFRQLVFVLKPEHGEEFTHLIGGQLCEICNLWT